MCTVVGLSAAVAVCQTLVQRTNPGLPLSEAYGVALHEQHYRELFMRAITPPAIVAPEAVNSSKSTATQDDSSGSLLMMGFPSRIVEAVHSLCACHNVPSRGGYLCTRCMSKVCALPASCPVCGLQLILSTHLARSYHHLFPLKNWLEVSWERARERPEQTGCFGCLTKFQNIPPQGKGKEKGDVGDSRGDKAAAETDKGVSESGRYECDTCGKFFCIDCDLFCHEIVHNCPGCQSTATGGSGGTVDEEAAAGSEDVVMSDVNASGVA